MSAEEVGQYVLLMCHAWLGGKNASLPNNPILLARYARCEHVSDTVMHEWNEGADGRLYNDTLSEEWTAAIGRSAHGVKAASARWKREQYNTNTPAMPEHSASNAPTHDGAVAKPNQSKPIQSNTVSSVSSTEQAVSLAEAVILLPLNDGSEHPVTQTQVDEWERTYPIVDVMQELREMRAWLDANPSRRKTKRGIRGFIVKWLGREQDRGPRAPTAHTVQPGPMPQRKPMEVLRVDA
jgi:uncharacterized protein YdaU (DUF1376 family)